MASSGTAEKCLTLALSTGVDATVGTLTHNISRVYDALNRLEKVTGPAQ